MISIREIIRLKSAGLSGNKIAQSLNVSRSVIQSYLKKVQVLTQEQVKGLSDDELLKLVSGEKVPRRVGVTDPDWVLVSKELSRRGVTLMLLWEEYSSQNPNGHSYSNYCLRFRRWRKVQKVSMRQVYKAGEKAFVDYAGMKLKLTERQTGVVSEVEIFVMALGASNLTYAEAQYRQDLKSWVAGHERAFRYYGGVPEIIVPDNLKAGVTSPCRYEPELNRGYGEFAEHYDLTVLPARVRKPQDKAKVEEAVQNVERRILAALRNQVFYSLEEINQAIRTKLHELNSKKMQLYKCSRWELFNQIEKDKLRALPINSFELGSWKIVTVNIDYHIEIDRHYYSVPYQMIGQKLEVRYTEKTVLVLQNGKSVAQHLRSYEPFKHSTLQQHMPPEHRYMKGWNPERLLNWAGKYGEHTKLQVQALLDSRKYPEQAYRSCLGVLRLADKFGKERLEAACKKANCLKLASYKNVHNILRNNQDKIEPPSPKLNPIMHENLRGHDYFH